MRRRELVLLAGGAAALTFGVRAESQAAPVVGFLNSATAAAWRDLVAACRAGLAETGFVEGRNLAIEFRWAEGRYERLPTLAAELVRREVAVIVATGGPPAVRAAMGATKSIPIVFTLGADPVEQGIVSSLGRPGGNATGVTLFTRDLLPKRLELLHDVVPKAAKIAVLSNSNNPTTVAYRALVQATARSLQRQLVFLNASSPRDLGNAFESVVQERAAGLLVVTDPLFEAQRRQLIALAARHSISTIHAWREDAEAGGLMSYGASIQDSYRKAGVYTGRVLRGARPAEMPIELPTQFELVINLKTAKALGVTVPPALLARADQVIE